MSIFKESFRQFVRQQLAIREAIVSHGNDGDSRFNSVSVDLSKNKMGGKNITVDPGAFFVNAGTRQCIIRMSSGCNLTDFGSEEFVDKGEGPNSTNTYERSKHIKGSGLARRYVLQGGTLAIDRETLEYSNITNTNISDTEQIPFGSKKVNAVEGQDTRVRKEKYKYRLGNRSGFAGVSKNRFGTAYGDPTIRANPGEDYGSVPMPGITMANIRTKSAYGSLREAKVDFVCHNQRQLEALELLYMRPGIPILLEWGWSPYIDNKGKIIKDFPFIGEWWIDEGSMDSINRTIIQEKKKSGGNYDALAGMCKNFSYKARPDGGYDCTTEIIAAGEIIETLKGQMYVAPKDLANSNAITIAQNTGGFNFTSEKRRAADFLEVGLQDFHNFSLAVDRNTDDEGDQRSNFSMEFYQVFGGDETWNFWDFGDDIEAKIKALKRMSKGKLSKPSPVEHLGDYFGYNDLSDDELEELGYEGDSHRELVLDALKTVILTKDSYFPRGDSEGYYINAAYIRWDAMCNYMNRFVINKDGFGKPIVTLSTTTVVDEDTNPSVQPLLMSRIPINAIPLVRGGQLRQVKNFNVRVKPWGPFNNFDASFPVGSVLNASVDPGIALFPEQLSFGFEGRFEPALYWGAIAIGFGINPLAGAAAYAGAELYREWAGETKMRVNKKNSRNIGNIYINVDRMLAIYKEQRYNGEGELNDDFNLYDFLKKIWDDVSAAGGNKHKFILHNDLERPEVLRIIDANFQKDDELDPEKMHVLKIQSNDSICREFSYNSVIPNELSATIGVAMQNPDSIQDIDGATFAALSKGIRSRFHVPAIKERKLPEEEERKTASEGYDELAKNTVKMFNGLAEHQALIFQGDYQKIDDETGESTATEEISRAKQDLKSFYNHLNKLVSLHYEDGNYPAGKGPYFKGFPKKYYGQNPPVSSVIPLKFNAKLDGISGITIGNLFKVDPTRLPKAYKANDIGFVCMGETQAVTAGQDWTTDIHGQLVLLPAERTSGDNEGQGTGIFKGGSGFGVGAAGAAAAGSLNSGDEPGDGTLGNQIIEPGEIELNVTASVSPTNTVLTDAPENSLDRIDQCPDIVQSDGTVVEMVWNEEAGICVQAGSLADPDRQEELVKEKEEQAEERYERWLKNVKIYFEGLYWMNYYALTVGTQLGMIEARTAGGGLMFVNPNDVTVQNYQAYFRNTQAAARNIVVLQEDIEEQLHAVVRKKMGTDKGLKLFDGDVLTLGESHITNIHLRKPDEIIRVSQEIMPYTRDDAKYFHEIAGPYYTHVTFWLGSLAEAMIPLSQKIEESAWVLVDPRRKDAGSYDGRRPQGTYAGSELWYLEDMADDLYGFGDTAVKYKDRPGYALVQRSDLIKQLSYDSDGFIYGQFPEFTTANANYIAFVEITNYIGSDKQKQLLKDYPDGWGKLQNKFSVTTDTQRYR